MQSTRIPRSWERLLTVSFERNLHLLVAALIYVPFIFLGYGEQPDSYLIVATGRDLITTGEYFPSRRPGSVVYEFPQAALNYLGGSALSNLGSLLMSLVFLAAFTHILKRLRIPNREILIWGMILLPAYWNSSTVTIDYVWALALATAGFVAAMRRKYFLAAVLCGLAIGSRLATVISVLGFVVYVWLEAPQDRKRIVLSAAVALLVVAACFIPPFASAGWTTEFLNVSVNLGESAFWTPWLRIGRFAYKNIYLWGLLGTITLLISLLHVWKARADMFGPKWRNISIASLIVVLSYELFFLKYPFKIEYMLPMIPFVIMLMGIALRNHRRLCVAIVLAVASYNVVSINIARPDQRWQARGASYGLWVERGLLLQYLRERLLYRHCNEIQCVARANEAARQRDGQSILF